MIADADIAEDLRARSDHHAIADGGMPLAGVFSRAAERDALVHQDVVADLAGFADHHAHSVIDEAAAADGRAGMDFDAGHRTRKLRGQPRQQYPAAGIEAVRHPMQHQRVKAGIAQNNFEHAPRGRIAPENGVDLLANDSGHVVLDDIIA